MPEKAFGRNHEAEESLLKLKQQESVMEQNLINFITNMRLKPETLRLVLCNLNDISQKREILLTDVKRSLEEIAKELKLTKFIMGCPMQIEKLDTSMYKQRLVRLSQGIRDFKESCQLESLSQEQIAFECELREFELNLGKYDKINGHVERLTSMVSISNKENKKCHDYKEIENFQALIAKTGHTENWNDQDHLLFMKMRKKCSNIPALVSVIRARCPDLTVESIVNHETWYRIYSSLREKQRSTIREWRKQKEKEKTRNNCENGSMSEILQVLSSKTSSDIAEKFPIHMTNKCERKLIGCVITDIIGIDSSNRRKELRQWKVEKENKRMMDKEQTKLLIKSKLIGQEKHKMGRFQRIQHSLTEYRKKNSMKDSSRTIKDDSRAKQKYNQALIEAFRKQDEEYIKRKRNLIRNLQRPTESQTIRIVRSQRVETRRDYSTLLNSTKAWNERCKELKNACGKEPKKLEYIKDIPRLSKKLNNSSRIMDILTYTSDLDIHQA